MKKISEFLSESFQFLVVKFSIYMNRRVFVMVKINSAGGSNKCFVKIAIQCRYTG